MKKSKSMKKRTIYDEPPMRYDVALRKFVPDLSRISALKKKLSTKLSKIPDGYLQSRIWFMKWFLIFLLLSILMIVFVIFFYYKFYY